MSYRRGKQLLGCVGLAALLWLAMPTVGHAQACFGTPTCAPCGPGGHNRPCPPYFSIYVERPPKLCWHHSCPHPVCNPCDLPNWGYYEPCWTPWPFAPNYSHCYTVPPAATVTLNPMVNPNVPFKALPQPTPNFPTPRTNPGPGGVEPPDDGPIELPPPRRLENLRKGN